MLIIYAMTWNLVNINCLNCVSNPGVELCLIGYPWPVSSIVCRIFEKFNVYRHKVLFRLLLCVRECLRIISMSWSVPVEYFRSRY